MESKWREVTCSIGLLILRLGVGAYMMTHGWGKLDLVLAGKFKDFADPIGLGSSTSLVLATFGEFVCPIFVILGLGTRFAAIPVVFTMGVAAFVVHDHAPWTTGEAFKLFAAGEAKLPVSKESALLFLIPFLALAFTGAGKFSLDSMLFCSRCRSGKA